MTAQGAAQRSHWPKKQWATACFQQTVALEKLAQ
jgi:hypothetical protein